MARYKIIHQREKCIGCAYCEEVAPDLFQMKYSDGKAILLHAGEKKGFYALNISEAQADSARLASSVCPVKIIQVRLL